MGTLRGALGALLDVAWSPDGKAILGAGVDKALRLWDVSSGRVRHTLTGHTDKAVAAAFAPKGDADRAFSAGHDRCIKVRVHVRRMHECWRDACAVWVFLHACCAIPRGAARARGNVVHALARCRRCALSCRAHD
jgi:hypothetical protein